MMKRFKLRDILIDAYVIASILAVFAISHRDTSEFLFALGAKSWFVCLALGGAGEFSQFVGVLAFLWVIAFPVMFVVFYIMVRKKKYTPFCVIISIDSIIILLWYLRCKINGDAYALQWARLDAIVSILYSVLLIVSCSMGRRDGSRTGDGLREP